MANKYAHFSKVNHKRKRIEKTYKFCERKVQFIDRLEAEKRIREIWAESKFGYRCYRCPNCKGWHLATLGKGVRPKFEKFLEQPEIKKEKVKNVSKPVETKITLSEGAKKFFTSFEDLSRENIIKEHTLLGRKQRKVKGQLRKPETFENIKLKIRLKKERRDNSEKLGWFLEALQWMNQNKKKELVL